MTTIKVKYKVGDKLWCLHNSAVRDFEVKRIEIGMDYQGTTIKYLDANYGTPNYLKNEKECFPTRAALIKSLN